MNYGQKTTNVVELKYRQQYVMLFSIYLFILLFPVHILVSEMRRFTVTLYSLIIFYIDLCVHLLICFCIFVSLFVFVYLFLLLLFGP